MADIAINVKSFGVVGEYDSVNSTGVDDTLALKSAFNAIVPGTTLLFPKTNGNIAFSEHLIIEDKSDFKLLFFGSMFYDKGKYILLADSTDGTVPVGIEFKNCERFEIVGLQHNGFVSGRSYIHPDSELERVPQIDFNNCKNYRISDMGAHGMVGRYINNLTVDVAHFMRASYFRFVNCEDFIVEDSGIAEGAGGGEFFSFTKCKNYKFIRPYHYQGQSIETFWSLGKMIDLDTVTIDDVRVKSNSPGSLFDVSGRNITLSNSDVDFPEGKFIDITKEWGSIGGDIDGVKVINCHTNGRLATTVGDAELTVDNITFINSTGSETTEMTVSSFKNLSISKTKYVDKLRLLDGAYSDPSLNFNKNINYEDVEITFDKSIDLTQLETHGTTTFKRGKIHRAQNGLGVTLVDVKASMANVVDLRNSSCKFIFNDTEFKNCRVDIRANTTFKNCTFDNISLTSNSLTYQHITIAFEKCDFNFNNTSPITTNAEEYFNLSNNSPFYITFDDCTFDGILVNNSTLSLFDKLSRSGSIIEFNRGRYDVRRYRQGVTSFETYFTLAEDSHVTIKTNGSNFIKTRFVLFTGGRAVNTNKVFINVNNTIFSENSIALHASNTVATNNKTTLIMTNNQVPASDFTGLSAKSSEFEKWVSVGYALV